MALFAIRVNLLHRKPPLFLLGIISLPLRFFKPTERTFHSLLKYEGGFCTAQKLNTVT